MLIVNFIFFAIYFGCILCSSNDELPEVNTPLGRVRGFWKKSLDGRRHAAFEGIPYAKPPVGDLRFEDPQPVSPWNGTWLADKPRICSQFIPMNRKVRGDEDCLHLNVYLPAQFLNSTEKLDVIFVIHGGAFMLGHGHVLTQSEFFMDKDVVLVSINYRLGILGFLSTEDDTIPGNNGLKDQVQALKWVRDNIASFGGNPNSVTILGMSAGGSSVHFHYFSPLSKGLFHKGFSQSGTVLAPWTIKENPLEDAKKLAVLLGCPVDSTSNLKICLKGKPVVDLINQTRYFYGYSMMPFSPFAPVVEKGSSRPFLDKNPYWLLKEGKLLDLPWITSHNADDGLWVSQFYWNKLELEEIDKRWTEISPYFLDCNYTLPETRKANVSRQVLDYYFESGEKINRKNFNKFTQIFTDRFFGVPGEMAAKMQANVTASPVYYYYFNYEEGENKAVEVFTHSREIKGVSHGEDCIYLQGLFYQKPFSEQDKRLKNAFHNMLYAFASTGKPSFDGTDNWQPTESEELTYLNITGPENMKLQRTKNLTPSVFWTKLDFQENENVIEAI